MTTPPRSPVGGHAPDFDPSLVRGIEIRIECFHCTGSGRVRAGKKAYEQNGEMLACPICGGSRTTRKVVPLTLLYDLLFGNLRAEPPTDGRASRHAVGDRVEQLGAGPGEVPVGTFGRVDAFSEVGEDLYLVNWDGIGTRWWPARYVGRTSSEGGRREP